MIGSTTALRAAPDEDRLDGAEWTRPVGAGIDGSVDPDTAPATRRPTLLYALIAIGALGLIGAVQLAVSLALAQGSFEIANLTAQSNQLSRTTQSLQEQLTVLESPQYLAKQAEKLGMQSPSTTTFVRLSSGKTIKPVKSLTAAYQKLADAYHMSVSGNLVANSNLSGQSTSVANSAIGAAKSDLGSAFAGLAALAGGQGGTVAASGGDRGASGGTAAGQTAAPPMSSVATGGAVGSGSAENGAQDGVASSSASDSGLALSANQMPAPTTR